jgi:carbon-monoxide dehydrogenase large subunit
LPPARWGSWLQKILPSSRRGVRAAQGLAQALLERVVYDENGQLLTATLSDYAVPKADGLPTFESEIVATPSPVNPLGAKGIGEAGAIGAPPALVNAILDALRPTGPITLDLPVTPERLWRVLQAVTAR